MIQRYSNLSLESIFSDEHKLGLWQETEIAVIEAMSKLGMMPPKARKEIVLKLTENRIDIAWWQERDKAIHHDLNAFLDERLRHLEKSLHQYFHKNITSYDTEEPAFARMLSEALGVLQPLGDGLEKALTDSALLYRHTIMLARTHGQGAELQSFGARILGWLAEYRLARQALADAAQNLRYSKLSGAIGKYGGLDPVLEHEALKILGFTPFYGVTQIMPRTLYAPVAQSLANLVAVLDKTANDIRLGARSGRPIMQEPFGKKQKGSSAMPQKKNTIRTEQIEGLARMARGYASMIAENIRTWEERAIEQSSVERVAWPDLCHVAAQALKVMTEVIVGLRVYPDNMLLEIQESRGTYASAEAKEFLKTGLSSSGLDYEDVYRIVQLACFNAFEPDPEVLTIRERRLTSFAEAAENLWLIKDTTQRPAVSIADSLPLAKLRPDESLDIGQEKIDAYNHALDDFFRPKQTREEWQQLFRPENLLRHETLLYEKILRV